MSPADVAGGSAGSASSPASDYSDRTSVGTCTIPSLKVALPSDIRLYDVNPTILDQEATEQ